MKIKRFIFVLLALLVSALIGFIDVGIEITAEYRITLSGLLFFGLLMGSFYDASFKFVLWMIIASSALGFFYAWAETTKQDLPLYGEAFWIIFPLLSIGGFGAAITQLVRLALPTDPFIKPKKANS